MTTDSEASGKCLFTYYPGASTGYSGFTDHHAMRSDLNNWLRNEADDIQYWLAGFGAGFVQAAMRSCKEKDSADLVYRLTINSDDPKVIKSVDWLQRLQLSGVDTGSPSTMNLYSSLEDVCQEMGRKGSIRQGYWEKGDEDDLRVVECKDLVANKIYDARQQGLHVSFSIL
jgi:hypothetical protein